MSPTLVDTIIVSVVVLGALFGIASGLVRAMTAFLCGFMTLVMILFGYGRLANIITVTFNVSARTAVLLAFGILVLVAQVICSQIVHRAARPFVRAVDRPGLLHGLDRLLGAVPGMLFGLLVTAVLLAPVALTLALPTVGAAVRDARLAPRLLHADATVMSTLRLRERLGAATQALGGPVVAPPAETGRSLPFRVPASGLAADPSGEAQLFALVNTERQRAGLQPLEWDPALAAVARQHAIEMFELGYFAHDSPITGSPFDRMSRAGIRYTAAGENLAFAPTVAVAHRGLMNSPGHRANILSPEFGRIGIGVIKNREFGLMVVQEFRNGH